MRFILLVFMWGAIAVYAKSIKDILLSEDRFRLLVENLNRTDMLDELVRRKTFTLVAPVNEAFNQMEDNVTKDQLMYHILTPVIRTRDLHEGQLIDTAYEKGTQLQLVKVTRSSGRIGLNGVEIIDADMVADKEVTLQVTRELLVPPADLDKTMFLEQDLNQFGHFAQITDVGDELRRANGYTVFVARDVLQGLDPLERAYLHHARGRDDLTQVLRHQIHDRALYSEDIPVGEYLYPSLQGEQLAVRNDGHKLTVNGVKVIHRDILASNGVIHLLESATLPRDRAFLHMTPRKALVAVNATKYLGLLDDNGLSDYLDDENAKPRTFLAPIDDEMDEGLVPGKLLTPWLQLHILGHRYTPGQLVNEALLPTESTMYLGSSGATQRIQVHIGEDAIQFNHIGLADHPAKISCCVIYPLVQPLALPKDPLSVLPTHLELSTFVASLYASGAADALSEAQGVTVFAPTNTAFSRLGLVAKYLLRPEAQEQLSKMARYHMVQELLYYNETKDGDYRLPTLAGTEISVKKSGNDMLVRGAGADDQFDRIVIARVMRHDLIVANGVVHTVDRAQLPSTVSVTLEQLLQVEDTHNFGHLLYKTGIANEIFDDQETNPYTLIAPSDSAFTRRNFSVMQTDPEQLLRIAKQHILPVALPSMMLPLADDAEGTDADTDTEKDRVPCDMFRRDRRKEITRNGTEFPSLLSKDNPVIIKRNDKGYTVQVKGTNKVIQVTDLGRTSHGGGVIMVDELLFPYEEETQHTGLRWWVVLLIVIGVLVGLVLLGLIVYFAYRRWKQQREGTISLGQ